MVDRAEGQTLSVQLGKHHDVSQLLIDRALELDKAYIPTRYPNAYPSGTPGDITADEAGRLITHAEAILAFCQDLLSKI